MNAHSQFNDHTHAVMFHHFHNEQHPPSQGSISAEQFADMIDWLSDRYSLLNADEYLYKLTSQTLDRRDICLTFDDALLCQSEIAAPILKSRNIQAFFFIYSSPFMGSPDYLEIYRYFRTTAFKSVDAFYEAFFTQARTLLQAEYTQAEARYDGAEYLKAYPFYTANDKWFRYLRDDTLGKERYEAVMQQMMAQHGFSPETVLSKLWMTDKHVQRLQSDGHLIGLHTFSHPTALHLLDRAAQEDEYRRNSAHLSELLNARPVSMSHPCGNYNTDTLDILGNNEIEIGFRSNNSIKSIRSALEVPREDHINVLKVMTQ